MSKKLIFISDSHNRHNKIVINECDFLVHSGDFTMSGTIKKTLNFLEWFKVQPAKYKILVAGNHDFFTQDHNFTFKLFCEERGIIYLEDEGKTIEGINFYGSPHTPKFGKRAWGQERGDQIEQYWKKIPDNTNVLITHGAAFGILDKVADFNDGKIISIGCKRLLKHVKRVKPRYYAFGHLHANYGIKEIDETTFINASQLNDSYELVNKPIEIDYND